MSATLVVIGGIACWAAVLILALALCRAAWLGDEQARGATDPWEMDMRPDHPSDVSF